LVGKVNQIAEECHRKAEGLLQATLRSKEELELSFTNLKEYTEDYTSKMDDVIFTFKTD
jgi:hypothetical protein